jgi:hypothetical protein
MTGVAIEQMLEPWCVELRQVKAHPRFLFAHPSIAASAAVSLGGLLGLERRRTSWMRAESAGDPGLSASRQTRAQPLGTRTPCMAWYARIRLRRWPKRRRCSSWTRATFSTRACARAGLGWAGRQYTGSAGKITNCQIGVFAVYVSDKGLRAHRLSSVSAQGLD